MISKDTAKGPKRRDEAALQVMYDITLPVGTILRQDPGKAGTFTCGLEAGQFTLTLKPGEPAPAGFKRVVA